MKSVRNRFAESNTNGEEVGTNSRGIRSRISKKLLVKSLIVFLVAVFGIKALSSMALPTSKPVGPITPRCEQAPEPYFNKGGSVGITIDGQQIYIVDGIFGSGDGTVLSRGAPYIPTCDQVDGDILKTVGNLLVDVPLTDEAGNITGHERLFLQIGIIGGYSPVDPQKALSGEQQTQP